MAPKTFFDLPAEVRNIIYRLAFHKSTAATPALGQKSHKACKPARKLRISKAFDIEAAPFIYGLRKFQFDSIYMAAFFLMSIGPSNSAHITSISLGTLDTNHQAATGLEWMLHCPFKDILSESIKLLATRCPSLRQIEVEAELYTAYDHDLDRRISSLEDRERLLAAFPQLSNMSHGWPNYAMGDTVCLSIPDIPIPGDVSIVF
jgi:hypothetical protein